MGTTSFTIGSNSVMDVLYHQTSDKLKMTRKQYLELSDATRRLAYSWPWQRSKIVKEIVDMMHRHTYETPTN